MIGLTALAAPAAAAPIAADDPLPIELANPNVPKEVIDGLPDVIKQSDAIIAENFDPNAIIYYLDGTLVEGQSKAVQARARICQTYTLTGPIGGAWSKEQVCGSVLWGSPGATIGYTFTVNPSSVTYGCLQGSGYNSLGNKQFYSIGCGNSASRAGIPWGNIIGNPSARAKTNGITGVTLAWSIL